MTASTNPTRLEIAFDVGHSSIGWAVLAVPEAASPSVLGCGSVIFEKDSALANTRRLHRSQRRHVRATRQRIARMEKLLEHFGIFTAAELAAKHCANGGSATPWLLAARVLASDGKSTLTWSELWDVLRWYAHNRGYEEITGEVHEDEEPSAERAKDTEKVAAAKAALDQFGKNTMAETICAWLGQDPLGPRTGTTENYKAKNCAFERSIVVAEVTRLLAAHRGKLPGVDESLIATLLLDARALSVPSIRLPLRYQGSLLFGRLATRYHNRIIGRCPISGEKIPNKSCTEFLHYRWAMQLANLRLAESADGPLRPLKPGERSGLHAAMLRDGALTSGELKKLVAALPGHARDNLEQFFLHPDAKEGLILDPIQKFITGDTRIAAIWPHLPVQLQIRARGRWRRGKTTTLAKLRDEAARLGHDCAAFDLAVETLCAPLPAKSKKKTPPPTRTELLGASLDARRELAKLSGRAPYARPLLAKAFDEVMAGLDPKASGGSLEETDEVRRRRESRPLPQQTNNHLVRHRLQILGRLLKDLAADPAYGAGQPARITRITLEVNRDLRTMAGLSSQDLAKELGKRGADHKHVAEYLVEKLPPGTPISAGLIRKGRIAHDLHWRCPYTDQPFEPIDLVTRRVDKDHIIPRSTRQSDSLESLVVTFSEVNRMKGKRTALQFIEDDASKQVSGLPNLSIATPAAFQKLARAHAPKSDPRKLAYARGERVDEDALRCWRRKDLMLTKSYDVRGGGFTPGQLTQTSQLGRLGAQIVRTTLPHLQPHDLVALPGSVTGAVRKAWDVLGCLSAAAPGVLETVKLPDGTEKSEVRTKTEIRDITHLHHALDACVLALAAHFIPNRGDVWRLLAERRLNAAQQAELAALGLFDFDERGQFRLRDLSPALKEQVRQKLAERRVVQHVPADMSGLRVEENTRGIVRRENGRVFLQQRQKKDGDGVRPPPKFTDEAEGKVIGLPRADGTGGKLAALNGVRVIDTNFGVAILDDTALPPAERFVIIPHERVWKRIEELKTLNGGKKPKIVRKGNLIELQRAGVSLRFRIFGTGQRARGFYFDAAPVDAIDRAVELSPASLVKGNFRVIRSRLTGSE